MKDKSPDSIERWLFHAFSLDRRSLVLFRVALSMVIARRLYLYYPFLTEFFTDRGILRIADVVHAFPNYSFGFFLEAFSHESLLRSYFFLSTISLLCLCFGFWVRAQLFFLCFLLNLLMQRNPLITNGGDAYLILLIFWSLFLPLTLQRAASWQVTSWGTIAFISQIGLVYGCNALEKMPGGAWFNGTALQQALQLHEYRTSLAPFLLSFPGLLKMGSVVVLSFEALVPFALLNWGRAWKLRMMAVSGIFFFHFLIGNLFYLDNFSYVCCIAVIPLIPSEIYGVWPFRLIPFQLLSPIDIGEKNSLSFRIGHQIAPLFFLFLTLVLNLSSLSFGRYKPPAVAAWIGNLLGLHQSWGLFTSEALSTKIWLVIPAQFPEGPIFNLYSSKAGEHLWEPPEAADYPASGTAERQQLINIKEYPELLPRYYIYLCKKYSPLVFDVYQLMQANVSNPSPPKKKLLRNVVCAKLRDGVVD